MKRLAYSKPRPRLKSWAILLSSLAATLGIGETDGDIVAHHFNGGRKLKIEIIFQASENI